MKLLLIAPEIKRRSAVNNFSGVWSWYLSEELKRRGIELRFGAPLHASKRAPANIIAHYRNLDIDGIDHILALGTRYFERVPRECGQILMSRFGGAVTQVHDAGRPETSCDCTFTLRSDRNNEHNHYVGWAADHETIRPAQIPGELRILVDHPDYGTVRPDHSEKIATECLAFVRSGVWRDSYSSVRLRRLVDGAIEDITSGAVGPYRRKPVSFEEVCAEYSKTHLFMVTHPESVGLTVLETAMAGALPVVPSGFIQRDRLATVRHFEHTGGIPWGDVLDRIDIAASRGTAIKNTWAAVAARMLVYFKNFRREPRKRVA